MTFKTTDQYSIRSGAFGRAGSDWSSEYLTMIDDCEKREQRLSDWERGFIDSIGRQLAQGKSLTTKQVETLDNIWEKATK